MKSKLKVWFESMKNKGFLIAALVFFVLFFFVSLMTAGTPGMVLDEDVGYWATQFEGTSVESVMKVISIFGSTSVILLLTVLIGLYLLVKRNWNLFFFFFVVSVGGVVTNLAAKQIVQRARPDDEVKHIEVFNYTFNIESYSFPSGHTMRATIFFLFILYVIIRHMSHLTARSIGTIICFALIGLVALSRVILDAHYVTDVIGAVAMGVAWFLLCAFFFHRPRHRRGAFYINR